MKIDPRVELSRDVQDVQGAKVDQRSKVGQNAKVDEARSVPPAVEKPPETPVDAVKLSDSLKLADAAVRAAAISGDVRPQAVARARQLMATGGLLTDLDVLADRIIDSLLESRDNRT